jgi:hypothetical protein
MRVGHTERVGKAEMRNVYTILAVNLERKKNPFRYLEVGVSFI